VGVCVCIWARADGDDGDGDDGDGDNGDGDNCYRDGVGDGDHSTRSTLIWTLATPKLLQT